MSSQAQMEKIMDLAIEEDTSRGDITSKLLIPAKLKGKASVLAKEEGLLAGGDIARIVFLKIDPSLEVEVLIQDGKKVKTGDIVATITGSAASILRAERVALNFLSQLSGIATETAKYIDKVKGLDVAIADTRKTSPGLRMLGKYAVYAADGEMQRPDLASGILIKDNHLVALRASGIGIKEAVAMAKKNAPQGMKVEVEVNTAQGAQDAAEGGADIIMLDNMSPEEMKRAVGLIPDQIKIEASGGVTLDNVRTIAMTGVGAISVGAITHSAKALDFSLEFEPGDFSLEPQTG